MSYCIVIPNYNHTILLDELIDSALRLNQRKIRDLMIKLVPEFKPQSKISDLLYKE